MTSKQTELTSKQTELTSKMRTPGGLTVTLTKPAELVATLTKPAELTKPTELTKLAELTKPPTPEELIHKFEKEFDFAAVGNHPCMIAVEGLDGSGKSTVVKLLGRWIDFNTPYSSTTYRCPGDPNSAFCQTIRRLLFDDPTLIKSSWAKRVVFLADHQELLDAHIVPDLQEGRIVICDRFTLSNLVYGHYGDGLPRERLARLDGYCTSEEWKDRIPKLTIVLDAPVEALEPRRKRKNDADHNYYDEADLAFRERLRRGYLIESYRHPRRSAVIDAEKPLDEVMMQVKLAVARKIFGFRS